MCLVLLAHRPEAKFPLILIGNRDEYFARPTEAAHFWEAAPSLLAGRDLQGGGTWLGVTRQGRWATVTNFRDFRLAQEAALSRGKLVTDYLQSKTPVGEFVQNLAPHSSRYNPFNLLAGDGREIFYLASRDGSYRSLSPGIYGLSNHLLDTPWPKLLQAKERFSRLLSGEAAERELPVEALFEILQDRQVAPDESLPDTGVGLERERWLSSIFIAGEDYGTRSSTLLAFTRSGEVEFHEICFEPMGRKAAQRRFKFSIH